MPIRFPWNWGQWTMIWQITIGSEWQGNNNFAVGVKRLKMASQNQLMATDKCKGLKIAQTVKTGDHWGEAFIEDRVFKLHGKVQCPEEEKGKDIFN